MVIVEVYELTLNCVSHYCSLRAQIIQNEMIRESLCKRIIKNRLISEKMYIIALIPVTFQIWPTCES